MTRSTNNAFTPRLCMISGTIKPEASLKATSRETQLFSISKAEREKIVMANAPNGISIPTQESDDRSRRVAGRRIGV